MRTELAVASVVNLSVVELFCDFQIFFVIFKGLVELVEVEACIPQLIVDRRQHLRVPRHIVKTAQRSPNDDEICIKSLHCIVKSW